LYRRTVLTSFETVASSEESVNLLGSEYTLKALTVQEFLLELVERLGTFYKRLCALAIAATEGGSDKL
jgi:hypothetical protein